MLGICFTNSAYADISVRYPPGSPRVRKPYSRKHQPLTANNAASHCPTDGKRVYCSQRCAEEARRKQTAARVRHIGKNNNRCNSFTLGKPCATRLFEAKYIGRMLIPFARFNHANGYTMPELNLLYEKSNEHFNTEVTAYGKKREQ